MDFAFRGWLALGWVETGVQSDQGLVGDLQSGVHGVEEGLQAFCDGVQPGLLEVAVDLEIRILRYIV